VAVSPAAFEQAFKSLKPGGTLIFVAMPADNFMQLPIFETVLHGITVVGSIVGTRVDLAETLQLHAEGRTRVVRESRQLEQVNDAFEQIEKRRGRRSPRVRLPRRILLAQRNDTFLGSSSHLASSNKASTTGRLHRGKRSREPDEG